MKLSERIILSRLLYPLWRIAWIERAFFNFCRLFNRAEQAAFHFYNYGFDVSKWQGAIDFAKMLIYGAKFLILRCVYGITQDQRFAEYMPEALVRFPVSVYVYYDPVYSPVAQADKVIAVLAPYKDRIRRVWLDLEFSWSGNYTAPQHWKTFRDRIRAAGYKTGWYTRATWWDSRVGSFAAEFATDPCWVAQYNNALTLIPKGWTKAMIWQNGTPAIGHEAGAESAEIDNDIWNDEFSFYDEWNAVISQPPPTEPPPTNGGTMNYVKVTASAGLNMRKGAGTSYAKVGALQFDTEVEYDVRQAGWLHIIRARTGGSPSLLANGQPVDGSDSWVSDSYVADIQQPSWATTTPPPDPDPDPEPPPPAGTTIINLEYHIENNELMKIVKDGVTIWSKP